MVFCTGRTIPVWLLPLPMLLQYFFRRDIRQVMQRQQQVGAITWIIRLQFDRSALGDERLLVFTPATLRGTQTIEPDSLTSQCQCLPVAFNRLLKLLAMKIAGAQSTENLRITRFYFQVLPVPRIASRRFPQLTSARASARKISGLRGSSFNARCKALTASPICVAHSGHWPS